MKDAGPGPAPFVIPAKAGISKRPAEPYRMEVPASAGTTGDRP
jgi:hypothetical protein